MDQIAIISDIASKYEIDSIGIFGSRARGDYREDSDYDIFIIGNLSLDEELSLEEELEKRLKTSVDIVKISDEFFEFYSKSRRLRNRLAHRYKMPDDEELFLNLKNNLEGISELERTVKELAR